MMKLSAFLLSAALCIASNLVSAHAMNTPEDAPLLENWEPQSEDDLMALHYYQYLNDTAEMNYHPVQPDPDHPSPNAMTGTLVGYSWATDGIVQFYQENYNNQLCTGGPTITSAGCVVTSFAMVANKYGYNTTPPAVVTQINTYAPGTQTACSFPRSSMPGLPAFTGLTYQNATHTTGLEADALAAIRGVINAGRPCIVYMQNASGGSHGVVCYGYEVYSTNSGYIYYHYIFNPSYAATSAGKTTIESYMANWWISGIHVYYN